jgi:hypothetical protein
MKAFYNINCLAKKGVCVCVYESLHSLSFCVQVSRWAGEMEHVPSVRHTRHVLLCWMLI